MFDVLFQFVVIDIFGVLFIGEHFRHSKQELVGRTEIGIQDKVRLDIGVIGKSSQQLAAERRFPRPNFTDDHIQPPSEPQGQF